MRRVECPDCGVKTEKIPWAEGKLTCCNVFRLFLATWARRLSWKETASCFNTSWDIVFGSVNWVVEYGLEHRDLKGVEAIGVDEVAYSKGHQYMTLVYQIDNNCKRLIAVIKDRKTTSLEGFFKTMGTSWCTNIKVACSDMWRPYLKVIAEKLPNALNILDRFHIVKKLNEAVNKVRVEEVKSLKAENYEPVMTGSKYCFLKRPENLTPKQSEKLSELLRYDLKTVRAYCHKEAFDAFWKYDSPYWARWFLKKWCTRVMRSRLDPLKKFVKTLRNHEDLLMNYFKANKQYSSGIVEGLNLRVNLCMRKAYGYRSFEILQISLYHTLGALPEPEFTHKFS
jgi:transposase